MKFATVACCSLLLILAVLVIEAPNMVEAAVTCSPAELSPCAPAITSSAAPSSACCAKVIQQKPCLCGYIKNPDLRQYVDSPGARRVSKACGVPIPTCS